MLVYTSIYGGYDSPKPPRPHSCVSEWRLYTDDESVNAPGWRIVVEARDDIHSRMRAKWRKCVPPSDIDTSLYLDGSIRLRSPHLIDAAIEALTRGDWA